LKFRIEALGKNHDRSQFDSGSPPLNEYLTRYAGQNQRSGMGKTYVALPSDSNRVVGFYTLSAGSVRFESLPDDLSRGLPKYPVPVAHMGRLAVCASAQGRGLGGILLIDALKRSLYLADAIGIRAMEVIARDDSARAFYERFGFQALLDDRKHLYLPLATARKALE
jgi:GNAT superfamily N-acetyltransferase